MTTFEAIYYDFRRTEILRRRTLGPVGRQRERDERMRHVAELNRLLAAIPPIVIGTTIRCTLR